MDTGTAFKLLFFILWPFILMLLYYLLDKKGFMKQLEKFEKNGWF